MNELMADELFSIISELDCFFDNEFSFSVRPCKHFMDKYLYFRIDQYKSSAAFIEHKDGWHEVRVCLFSYEQRFFDEGFTFRYNEHNAYGSLLTPVNFFIDPSEKATQFIGLEDEGLHDGHYQGTLHKGEVLRRLVDFNSDGELSVSFRKSRDPLYNSSIPEIRTWIKHQLG